MERPVCPYLGTLDADRQRAEPIAYPSFENRCWANASVADPADEMLMLTDQATYCLGDTHPLCPRFAAAAQGGSGFAAAGDYPEAERLASDLDALTREMELLDDDEAERRRVWGWLAAGALFLMVFAGSSLLALYAGWTYVRSLQSAADGSVETLAAAAIEPDPVYLVMTATLPPADTQTPTPGAILVAPPVATTPSFPSAVTATPGGSTEVIVVDPNIQPTPPPLPPTLPPTPTPVFDFAQPVPEAPTRRPTPVFEIPTSTPLPVEPSPTPVPILGPPIIVFKPDTRSLERDQCTTVRWSVQNVREVYYEGIGVNGQGEREECIDDEDEVFTLAVVLPSGISEVYTTTVRYIAPTATPTPSPTVTPTPYHTPTWTPVAPTATPTPNLIFGVSIGVDGSVVRSCAPGSVCTATLIAVNQGSGVDDLAIILDSGDQWSPQICRADGVCSDNVVIVNDVGPGNSVAVEFRTDVPADAQGQRATYTFTAASGATNNAIRSEPVTITVEVP